jgi:hypothetical protein
VIPPTEAAKLVQTAAITARMLAARAEPTNPEKDGSDDNMCYIVGPVVELVSAMSSTLAQHDGVCKSSASGRDMHRGSTSEVKTTHLEDPS